MAAAPPAWAAVVDFDGTLVDVDLGDLVVRRFAGEAVWRASEEAFRSGAIDFGTLLAQSFGAMRVRQAELAKLAREVARPRPGFVAWAEACLASGSPVIVCSAGLDAYIAPVLHDLPGGLGARLELVANRLTFAAQGGDDDTVQVSFPGAGRGCGRCGSCKAAVVEDLRARGFRVAYVGDGVSDRCAARVADLVFARASLLTTCRTEGLPHRPFDDFHDVAAGWPGPPYAG